MLGHLEAILGQPCATWGHLGAILGPSWAILGPSRGHLRAILGRLEAYRGHLGAILGPSWGHLGPKRLPRTSGNSTKFTNCPKHIIFQMLLMVLLGGGLVSKAILGTFWGRLGACLGLLGADLGLTGAILGYSVSGIFTECCMIQQ